MVAGLEAESARLEARLAQADVQIDRFTQGKRINELTRDYLQNELIDIMAQ